jgi:uncharacterized protein with von Willebrand factor type A (vWA) domain
VTAPNASEPSDFTSSVAEFSALLRGQHGYAVAAGTTMDALRAAEAVGLTDRVRLRAAFRAVYCTSPDQVARFDPVFDAFFTGPHGVAQPNLAARHTRPDTATAPRPERPHGPPASQPKRTPSDDPHATGEQRPTQAGDDAFSTWQALRARYSPAAARTATAPTIALTGMDAMLIAANRLIASVRIARSRRRTPHQRGTRVDLRRTLRASVATAGEPLVLHRTERARHGARFVVLIDGSRSMAEHAAPMLQFAYALCQRSTHTHAFAFSTALREITSDLREPGRSGRPLPGLNEAWGGGTRIGASLLEFVRTHGARLLNDETVVLIFSDGLDAGDLDALERAMRAIRTRSAGVIWLHPHAAGRGFNPTAAGMRTALPYLTLLAPARDAQDFAELAHRLRAAVALR